MQITSSTAGFVQRTVPDPRDVDAITVACRDRQITAWTTVPDPYTRAAVGVRVGDMLSDGWANDAPT